MTVLGEHVSLLWTSLEKSIRSCFEAQRERVQNTIACQSRWDFRLAFHVPGNIRARYQEQPSGSVLASFEVSRHCPRTPLSRPIAVAPISHISDPATSSSFYHVRTAFPSSIALSTDLLTALPEFRAEITSNSSPNLRWIYNASLQRDRPLPCCSRVHCRFRSVIDAAKTFHTRWKVYLASRTLSCTERMTSNSK
ncbi:hypothetical protein GE21DRAFT_1049253 [Neurospora crassa]|nr:hypothetical protein GE21DRAFT_1049253 [Neurospora crassa]